MLGEVGRSVSAPLFSAPPDPLPGKVWIGPEGVHRGLDRLGERWGNTKWGRRASEIVEESKRKRVGYPRQGAFWNASYAGVCVREGLTMNGARKEWEERKEGAKTEWT